MANVSNINENGMASMQTRSESGNFHKISRFVFISVMIILALIFVNSKAEHSFVYDPDAIEPAAQSVLKLYVNTIDGNSCTGSGFVLFDNRTLITNYHVIEGASSISAESDDGFSYFITEVLAYSKEKDIAIVRFSAPTLLTPLTISAERLRRGMEVVAIGSPRGQKNTVSTGIVSLILDEDVYSFQFTAPISPGSSGGALFNADGAVIGITSAHMNDSQNINFAISISEVQKLYSEWDGDSYYNTIEFGKMTIPGVETLLIPEKFIGSYLDISSDAIDYWDQQGYIDGYKDELVKTFTITDMWKEESGRIVYSNSSKSLSIYFNTNLDNTKPAQSIRVVISGVQDEMINELFGTVLYTNIMNLDKKIDQARLERWIENHSNADFFEIDNSYFLGKILLDTRVVYFIVPEDELSTLESSLNEYTVVKNQPMDYSGEWYFFQMDILGMKLSPMVLGLDTFSIIISDDGLCRMIVDDMSSTGITESKGYWKRTKDGITIYFEDLDSPWDFKFENGFLISDMSEYIDYPEMGPVMFYYSREKPDSHATILPILQETPTPSPVPTSTPTPKPTNTPAPTARPIDDLRFADGNNANWEFLSNDKMKIRFKMEARFYDVLAYELYLYAEDVWGNKIYGDDVYYYWTTQKTIRKGKTDWSDYCTIPNRSKVYNIYCGIKKRRVDFGDSPAATLSKINFLNFNYSEEYQETQELDTKDIDFYCWTIK